MATESPVTPATPTLRELTVRGILLGGAITLVFTAANVYLGLKVGLTFATAIPAAVISMAILTHVDASPAERSAYLKQAAQIRRSEGGEEAEAVETEIEAEEGEEAAAELTPERYAELSAKEQFVLTVSERGFGKRSSSYEYRTSGRGGKGIVAMVVNERNGDLVASFAVEHSDQIMLVTDGGQLIRCPVDDVRIAGRNTQGVRIFKTDDEERVVSVERISDEGSEGEAGDDTPEA